MVVLDRSWIPRPLRPLLSALWRSLEAALVRRADLTIAAHDSVMRQFDGGRVITVQNFPIMEDAVAVREVAVAKRPPRVLYHGDLTEQRGLLTMIDAIAQVNSVQAPELRLRSEEHTSELQSLMRISYAVFCLKKKKDKHR